MKTSGVLHCVIVFLMLIARVVMPDAHAQGQPSSPDKPGLSSPRPPRDDADLRYWLENMVWHHGYSVAEITAATGLEGAVIAAAQERLNITAANKPKRPVDPPLLVLPYPGGRHPRLGFFDGAVDPQRETKLSIFPPWQDGGYTVLDVPEAIWSNLGLTYLAHTHIPTLWSNRGLALPAQEWERRADGSFASHRVLPNGIEFTVRAVPQRERVELRMSLKNGTLDPLTNLRVQMCIMLGRARGFEAQTKENKLLATPFAAARSTTDPRRWIITAWQPVQRVWENPPCPCIHSDPQIPDCPPGESRDVHGWLSFYQGDDIHGEFKRLGEIWKPLGRTTITGHITSSAGGAPVPARLYIEGADGFHFAECDAPGGEAIRYDKKNWINPRAIERHTSLSAHPFRASLPPGQYTFTVERGPEYVPSVQKVAVGDTPLRLDFPLRRRVNMAEEKWFSGDTHIHRPLAELPTAMLAEDLNVAFPFTYWVTHAFTPPGSGSGDRTLTTDAAAPAKLIEVDKTHVIWPRNTEWEIFTVRGKQHTLGALFALNHQTPFAAGIPTLSPVIEQARQEGALFDMDKHDWPFALVLPPLLGSSLYELANNHLWRTEFGFSKWSGPAPGWAFPDGRERREGTEREWIEFTHRVYWALLNCGLRIQPTAGTASGVHPVPPGFGRVYVHLPEGFSYGAWIKGLAAGRSFVTTGPMLMADIRENEIRGRIVHRRDAVLEVIVNGRIVASLTRLGAASETAGHIAEINIPLTEKGTRWVALRAWEMDGERPRFAHTAPVWFDDPARPLRPRREEAEWLASRVRAEIVRSRDLLPAAAVAEYEQALRFYETAAQNATPGR